MAGIAIVSFANSPKGQNRPGMRAVMKYAMREAKTTWEGHWLVSGLNCTPQTVYDDFIATKLQHRKDGGRMFYHMVQSFPKGEAVPPETAHEMAVRLAEYFKDYEVLVCTHVDREHIHSHFIINSVAMDSGRKFHINTPELEPLRKLNDSLCMEYGFGVCQRDQKKTSGISLAEYHSAEKGESWKWRLMNVVDEAMRCSHDRDEFMAVMSFEGYSVSWSPTRQSITYTCPNGKKCRDRKLHYDKYLKEAMEREFRIRAEIISGRADGAQFAEAADGLFHDSRADRGADGEHGYAAYTHGEYAAEAEQLAGEAGAGYAEAEREPDEREAPTGWEAEREILFAPTLSSASHPNQSGMALGDPDIGGVAGSLVRLGKALERDWYDAPVSDATAMPRQHSKKKRKLAPGQREDDHEEEQGMTMKM